MSKMRFPATTVGGQTVFIVEKRPDSVYQEILVGEDGLYYRRSHGLKIELCERQPADATVEPGQVEAAAESSAVVEQGVEETLDKSDAADDDLFGEAEPLGPQDEPDGEPDIEGISLDDPIQDADPEPTEIDL